jgi:hypothetical protein
MNLVYMVYCIRQGKFNYYDSRTKEYFDFNNGAEIDYSFRTNESVVLDS